MIHLSPALLVSTANAFVGVTENAERVLDSESFVANCLREVHVAAADVPSAPWHTAFVHHVGYWSHYDNRDRASSWPLPSTADCNELAAWAVEHRVLHTEPEPGDVFLLWSARRLRFIRSGIVAHVHCCGFLPDLDHYYACLTIEGNTDESFASNGRSMLRHVRPLSSDRGDRFIRWKDIRFAAAEPAERNGKAA